MRPHAVSKRASLPIGLPSHSSPTLSSNPPSHQARYVVERADADLWLKVLDENNKNRKSLVDQVCVWGGGEV